MHRIIIGFLLTVVTSSAPIRSRDNVDWKRSDVTTNKKLNIEYLRKYDLLARPAARGAGLDDEERVPQAELTEAVKEFQHLAALPETGKIDEETLEMMHTPRCGNTEKPLVEINIANKRLKRFAYNGGKWPKNIVTYKIVGYTKDMPRPVVQQLVKRAFKYWDDVTPGLTIQETKSNRANIKIDFASGDHGDGHPFDGPLQTLAHTILPIPKYGHIHFDDAERWTEKASTKNDINFLNVATHEIGHALGLAHSTVSNAVMYAFYSGDDNKEIVLSADDKQAVLGLYQ